MHHQPLCQDPQKIFPYRTRIPRLLPAAYDPLHLIEYTQVLPLVEHQRLLLPIIHSLTRKIKQLEGVLRYTLIDDAPRRLARFLVDHEHLLHHLTQRNIAQRIKLTPESTSRIIRTFKEKGWVEVRQKKLYLLDPEALQAFSG